MRTGTRYALALLLLPLFLVAASAWLAWRILKLLGRGIASVPLLLLWLLRTLILVLTLGGLVYVVGLAAAGVIK